MKSRSTRFIRAADAARYGRSAPRIGVAHPPALYVFLSGGGAAARGSIIASFISIALATACSPAKTGAPGATNATGKREAIFVEYLRGRGHRVLGRPLASGPPIR